MIPYGDYPATDAARAYEARAFAEQTEREHGTCEHHREQADLKINMTRYNGIVMSRVQAIWACSQDRRRSEVETA
jgi:hypothetical protein